MLDIRLFLSDNTVSKCQTVISKTFGNVRDLVCGGVMILPNEVGVGPRLQQKYKQQYQNGTNIYENIFGQIVVDDEHVLV
jgi:hypothetical protein